METQSFVEDVAPKLVDAYFGGEVSCVDACVSVRGGTSTDGAILATKCRGYSERDASRVPSHCSHAYIAAQQRISGCRNIARIQEHRQLIGNISSTPFRRTVPESRFEQRVAHCAICISSVPAA